MIGIIAVLAGILLPALGKARQSAVRIECLSNLRQVGLVFRLYANENHDQVPLGYRLVKSAGGYNPIKQYNSMIYSATARRYVGFGWLYLAGKMQFPKIFYCPAEVDPQSMFNTAQNPWPPGLDGNPAINAYCGYACRPEIGLPDDPADAQSYPWPHLAQFKSRAILADLTALPARVDTRHRTGINVLMGDGSGAWIARKVFDDNLRPCTSIAATFNVNQEKIWSSLDR